MTTTAPTTTTTTTTTLAGTVRAKSSCSRLILENSQRIDVLFAARLTETTAPLTPTSDEVSFDVYATVAPERPLSADYIDRLQKYVDDICEEGCAAVAIAGEDSSYDSDFETETVVTTTPANYHHQHQDVSRTTSDTLAAEYAEYVQTSPPSPGYTARVEFALKLGYTEKLVQAALHKLGPSPAQNELLAELIKLGAQKTGGGCDLGGGNGADHHHHHHHCMRDGGGLCDNLTDVSMPTPSITALQSPSTVTAGANTPTSAVTLLRAIVIDGSNVAMSHGNKEIFSCRGIKICVDWFRARGHKDITVFVPKWRKEAPRPDNPITDQEILAELEKDRLLVFTPSRLVGGKRMVCYDDRYVLRLAAEVDGVVVSNDNYRDLCQESVEFRKVVEERILMYSFVNDRFMPPDDPLGRAGPTLDNFLRCTPRKGGDTLGAPTSAPPPCPYGKKCTYGNKCKYHHPERGPYPHKSVTERLSEHALRHMQAREGATVGLLLDPGNKKQPLGRTRSNVPLSKDTANQHALVAKSRSVDNVGSSPVTGSLTTLLPCQQQQQQHGENLHRKLQRQLTLNPNGSDPRLMRRYVTQAAPSPQYNMSTSSTTWDNHQHVTRIASAPDSYRPWPPTGVGGAGCHRQPHQQQQQQQHMMQRTSSCSDSQLNVWPPSPGQQQQQLMRSSFVHHHQQQEDARRRLHYHLAAIFPEEQVMQAMQLYPDETNPQKICAAILAMFPSK